MAMHKEEFNGGLVTSAGDLDLQKGEMSVANNVEYFPGSQFLRMMEGHKETTGHALTNTYSVTGLRDVKFNDDTHKLIAEQLAATKSKYWTATVGDNPVFAELQSLAPTPIDLVVESGNSLETVHWQNRYFLFNGAHENLCYRSDGIARSMGLNPVSATPTVTVESGSSSADANGWYEYWTTIVIYFLGAETTELESTFGPAIGSEVEVPAAIVNITDITTQKIRVSRPGPGLDFELIEWVLADATRGTVKWRVYRSSKKEKEKDPSKFPIGFQIGEADWLEPYMDDGTAGVLGPYQPTATASTSTDGTGVTVANPDNAWIDDGVLAVWSVADGTDYSRDNWAAADYSIFGDDAVPTNTFEGQVGSPIAGIKVEIQAQTSAAHHTAFSPTSWWPWLDVQLSWNGGTSWSGGPIVWGAGGRGWGWFETSMVTKSFGSSTDSWGGQWPSGGWTAAHFTDANFQVRIRAGGRNASGVVRTISVDFVRVTVYSKGVNLDIEEKPFPAITVTIDQVDASIGRNGKPAIASTGDTFQGSLVTNDINNRRFVRWSSPLDPEYQPGLYFHEIDTDENDKITALHTINNRLGVFTQTSLHRCNYLPSELDSQFTTGRAFDEVDKQHGCIHEQMVTKITPPTGRQLLVYVSDDGVYATDLNTVREWSQDIDWKTFQAAVANMRTGMVELVNHPTLWQIRMYYNSGGVTYSYRFHYHPTHMKGDRPKVTGPCIEATGTAGVDFTVSSVRAVRRATGLINVFLGTSNGKLRRNNTRVGQAFDNAVVTTRRLGAIGKEWEVPEIYLWGTPDTASVLTGLVIKTDIVNGSSRSSDSLDFPASKAARIEPEYGVQLATFQLTNAGTDAQFGHLQIEGLSFEAEDEGL